MRFGSEAKLAMSDAEDAESLSKAIASLIGDRPTGAVGADAAVACLAIDLLGRRLGLMNACAVLHANLHAELLVRIAEAAERIAGSLESMAADVPGGDGE